MKKKACYFYYFFVFAFIPRDYIDNQLPWFAQNQFILSKRYKFFKTGVDLKLIKILKFNGLFK